MSTTTQWYPSECVEEESETDLGAEKQRYSKATSKEGSWLRDLTKRDQDHAPCSVFLASLVLAAVSTNARAGQFR